MSQLPLFRETVASNVITKIRNDVRTGKSGEHLVLAKLTRWGYDTHDAPQDSAYDVIVDHHGRVLRVQVKTRSFSSGSFWHNRVQRGNWRSATGTYEYGAGDYDIFAAVANSIERVSRRHAGRSAGHPRTRQRRHDEHLSARPTEKLFGPQAGCGGIRCLRLWTRPRSERCSQTSPRCRTR